MKPFNIVRTLMEVQGDLYEIIKQVSEEKKGPPPEIWKKFLGADKIFRKDGVLFFVKQIEEAVIVTDEPETLLKQNMKTYKIYLDDIRTPEDPSWTVVRSYNEFVETVTKIGLDIIDIISLDHDLGDTAIQEYYNNVSPNYELNYNNIHEKTGLDCAKWLINLCLDEGHAMPEVVVHSANPIGSANIMGYMNNFLKNRKQPQNCVSVQIKLKLETE